MWIFLCPAWQMSELVKLEGEDLMPHGLLRIPWQLPSISSFRAKSGIRQFKIAEYWEILVTVFQ